MAYICQIKKKKFLAWLRSAVANQKPEAFRKGLDIHVIKGNYNFLIIHLG